MENIIFPVSMGKPRIQVFSVENVNKKAEKYHYLSVKNVNKKVENIIFPVSMANLVFKYFSVKTLTEKLKKSLFQCPWQTLSSSIFL